MGDEQPVRGFSAQTRSVLAALALVSSGWRHGYDLAKETGLKSGTLYPILIRLADRGLVESTWEEEQPAGRPRRHLYRLTAQGVAAAETVLAHRTVAARPEAPAPRRGTSRTGSHAPAKSPRAGLAAEGT